ncbi:hypothetical protein GCM10009836_20020 [Pseudonocardia ailaonensis]|uniref:Integral membrane protein n=1 Tax=Pseudonocardia ailaonensis TaxID=367279 RepID=A0ABN2MVU3_9PSEU
MTAVAVARYLLSDAWRSQRVIIPVVLQIAVLAVLFGGDPGPLPTPWAASILALYPVSAWLALTLANTEDPVQRSVTVAAAGGPGPVAAGTLLVAVAGDLLLTLLSVAWPLVATHYTVPPGVLVGALLAHLAAGLTGTAVGFLCARPLVQRIGWSLLIALVVVIATAVQPWLPPVGSSVSAIEAGGHPGSLLVPVLVALVLAVVATAVSSTVARRG